MHKETTALTLDDLMGESYTVYLKRNKKFGYDLSIENDFFTDEGVEIEGIHPAAIKSFADFCRGYLYWYDKLQNEENEENEENVMTLKKAS